MLPESLTAKHNSVAHEAIETKVHFTSTSPNVVMGTVHVIDDQIEAPKKEKIEPEDIEAEVDILKVAIAHAVAQHDADCEKTIKFTNTTEAHNVRDAEQFMISTIFQTIEPYVRNGGHEYRKQRAKQDNQIFEETKASSQKGYSVSYAIHIALTLHKETLLQNATPSEFEIKMAGHCETARRYLLSYWDEYPLPNLSHLNAGDIPFTNEPPAGSIPYFYDEQGNVKLEACFVLGGTPTDHFHIVTEGAGILVAHPSTKETYSLHGNHVVATNHYGTETFIPEGATIILDGMSNELIINPTPNTIAYYQRIMLQQKQQNKTLVEKSKDEQNEKPRTLDGENVRVSGNIAMPQEAKQINDGNGNGIGLHRTEIILDNRTDPVTAQEFYKCFSEVAGMLKSEVYDIRIVDFEGDKDTNMPPEARKETIRNQMAAVLRLRSEYAKKSTDQKRIDLMYPNIESFEHFNEKQELLDEVAEDLNLPTFRLGVMAEIPSFIHDRQMGKADWSFASIGTNDLVNNLIGINRYDEESADRYDPTNPTVLETLQTALSYANWENGENYRAVSVCGKMASSPQYIALLLGLGARSLSCGPAQIPMVKELVRRTNTQEAKLLVSKLVETDKRADREELIREFCETRLGLNNNGTILDMTWQKPDTPYEPKQPFNSSTLSKPKHSEPDPSAL